MASSVSATALPPPTSQRATCPISPPSLAQRPFGGRRTSWCHVQTGTRLIKRMLSDNSLPDTRIGRTRQCGRSSRAWRLTLSGLRGRSLSCQHGNGMDWCWWATRRMLYRWVGTGPTFPEPKAHIRLGQSLANPTSPCSQPAGKALHRHSKTASPLFSS
jgi:hypothetical protein